MADGQGMAPTPLTTFLHHLPEGFSVVDASERFTHANPAAEAIFGVEPGGLPGRNLMEFLDSDQQALVLDQTIHRRRGQGDSYELRIRRADGSSRILWVTVIPDLNPEGNYGGAAGFFRDITEQRRVEAEREELIRTLQKALEDVRVLCGLLPTCSFCRKVRDDAGNWSRLETYLEARTGTAFSHGICPECMRAHYPEFQGD